MYDEQKDKNPDYCGSGSDSGSGDGVSGENIDFDAVLGATGKG